MQVELFYEARAALAEGPTWHARQQRLYWIDILGKRVHVDTELLLQLEENVGCLAPCSQDGLIMALGTDLVRFGAGASGVTLLARLDEPQGNRFNDGKCDPAGRFIAGTMDREERQAAGTVYSFDGQVATPLLRGVRISNGLTWSPDYKTFYYIDTPTRLVQAFDYDLANGCIANPRIAVQVPEALGWPDGMTTDLEGNLWIAMWGGAQVTKWDPGTGKLLEQIPVPALLVSSCTFGGPDLSELYVTSARRGLDAGMLAKYPLSGSLFKVRTRSTGLPAFEFRG